MWKAVSSYLIHLKNHTILSYFKLSISPCMCVQAYVYRHIHSQSFTHTAEIEKNGKGILVLPPLLNE